MLHKLKPVPRALIILSVVGALGYAAMNMDLMPKKVAEPVVEAPVVAPANAALEAANAATAAAKSAVDAEPSGLIAAPTPNAGAGFTYPFQKTAVSTYKVDNVLMTFAFKNQYQKEIGDLVTCITRNIDKLQTASMRSGVM